MAGWFSVLREIFVGKAGNVAGCGDINLYGMRAIERTHIGTSAIMYRYIDWSATVPLQMLEFYSITCTAQPNAISIMCWRLLIGTVATLAFGYIRVPVIMNA